MAIKIPTVDNTAGTYPGGSRAPYQNAGAMTAEGVPEKLQAGLTAYVAGIRSDLQSRRAAAAGMGEAAMRGANTKQEAINNLARGMSMVGAAQVDVSRMQGQYAQGLVQEAHNVVQARGEQISSVVSGAQGLAEGQRALGKGMENLAMANASVARSQADYGDSYGRVAAGMGRVAEGMQANAASQGRATEMEMRTAQMMGASQQGVIDYAQAMLVAAQREMQASYALGKSIGYAGEQAVAVGLQMLDVMKQEKEQANETRVLEGIKMLRDAKTQKIGGELLTLQGNAVNEVPLDEKTKTGILPVGMQFYDNTFDRISKEYLANDQQRFMFAARTQGLRNQTYEELFQHQDKETRSARLGAYIATQDGHIERAALAAQSKDDKIRDTVVAQEYQAFQANFMAHANNERWSPGDMTMKYRAAATKFWAQTLKAAMDGPEPNTAWVGDMIMRFDTEVRTYNPKAGIGEPGFLAVDMRSPEMEQVRKEYRPAMEMQESTLLTLTAQNVSRGLPPPGTARPTHDASGEAIDYGPTKPVDYDKANQLLEAELAGGKYRGRENIVWDALKLNAQQAVRHKELSAMASKEKLATFTAEMSTEAQRGRLATHIMYNKPDVWETFTPEEQTAYNHARQGYASELESMRAHGRARHAELTRADGQLLEQMAYRAYMNGGMVGLAEMDPASYRGQTNPDTGEKFTESGIQHLVLTRLKLMKEGDAAAHATMLARGGKPMMQVRAELEEQAKDLGFLPGKQGTQRFIDREHFLQRVEANIMRSRGPGSDKAVSPKEIHEAIEEALTVYIDRGGRFGDQQVFGYQFEEPGRMAAHTARTKEIAEKTKRGLPLFEKAPEGRQTKLQQFHDVLERRYNPAVGLGSVDYTRGRDIERAVKFLQTTDSWKGVEANTKLDASAKMLAKQRLIETYLAQEEATLRSSGDAASRFPAGSPPQDATYDGAVDIRSPNSIFRVGTLVP